MKQNFNVSQRIRNLRFLDIKRTTILLTQINKHRKQLFDGNYVKYFALIKKNRTYEFFIAPACLNYICSEKNPSK